ncbi:hypothetical protein PC129_g17603 [Phytophthora cactorum]|uniref:FYVE-type domain-containing protein n=2 Tax=Phytophthora cactorum TaxID=29920 RepID=A0A329RI61_9STRA|nr:hypothetical protein Pcac1_g28608 [Phytophthora cactorum]KAG2810270.1 hypothetical protein PC111_g15725 [Phytophthora cactorum]KAG2830468.1 hypothetical protein PC112_g7663 [Phytophthora cactorum]KAG2860307.1 hypothetical protein PC113_g8186 [Phytophthora cactorum]KAG2891541.1 hypothetical protein PC114_g16968 [Phytophthora cactorum]
MVDVAPLRRARTLQPLSEQRRDRARPASMREKIGARWHKSRLARLSSKTPEPPMARPKVRLRDGDVEAFRNLAHSVISRTLAHECEYRRRGCTEPDAHEWKLVKRYNGLRVYKCKMQPEFQPSLSQENALARAPTAVCIGTIDGSLEDVLYGLHTKTRREMHVTNAFLNRGHLECAVLSVIEHGSDRDPFKQLALKWILAQNFGDVKSGNYHDVCTIESTGTGVDGRGESFGYRLIKSVDLTEYPQLSTSNDVVRARMTMCCIFRQDANSRTVRVYSKGMLDMGEEAPSFVPNSDATCTMMLSIASATEIAEAKRLTLLALQRAEYSACRSQRTCEPEDSSRETEATVTSPLPAETFDLHDSFLQKMPSDPCSVCGKKPTMSKFVRASHRSCGVCKQPVCHKCHVKRRLFARSDAIVVACCKICIIASKRLRVDPREPCPMLSA